MINTLLIKEIKKALDVLFRKDFYYKVYQCDIPL